MTRSSSISSRKLRRRSATSCCHGEALALRDFEIHRGHVDGLRLASVANRVLQAALGGISQDAPRGIHNLREEVTSALGIGDIIGSSPGLKKVMQQIQLVAPTDAAVLVTMRDPQTVGVAHDPFPSAERGRGCRSATTATNCFDIHPNGPAAIFPIDYLTTRFITLCIASTAYPVCLAHVPMTHSISHKRRHTAARLDMIYSALSGPTRRAIIEQLRAGEATVSQLAAPHDMSLPAVSKHLRLLENAGLVTRRVEATTHYISFNPKPLDEAMSWIEKQRDLWRASLDRLAELVEAPEKTHTHRKNPNN